MFTLLAYVLVDVICRTWYDQSDLIAYWKDPRGLDEKPWPTP